jgi:hypothetical protein
MLDRVLDVKHYEETRARFAQELQWASPPASCSRRACPSTCAPTSASTSSRLACWASTRAAPASRSAAPYSGTRARRSRHDDHDPVNLPVNSVVGPDRRHDLRCQPLRDHPVEHLGASSVITIDRWYDANALPADPAWQRLDPDRGRDGDRRRQRTPASYLALANNATATAPERHRHGADRRDHDRLGRADPQARHLRPLGVFGGSATITLTKTWTANGSTRCR